MQETERSVRSSREVAKDAAEAVERARREVEINGGWAVIPLCPEGVKQLDVVKGLKAHGLVSSRMGTDSDTRTLFVTRGEPPRLLFRHLSPATRGCLASNAGVRTFFYDDGQPDSDRFVTLSGVNAERLLDLLSRLISELGGEKRFIDLHRMTVTRIATVLAASPALAEWRQLPEPSAKDVKPRWPVRPVRGGKADARASIYQEANHGRCFVSVDMSAANFQVLRNCGIIAESSWEALVSRHDVAFSRLSPEYAKDAKGLRMLALSTAALRPNLQRARWSQVVLDAFAAVIRAGYADGDQDLAAWNSDEVLLHADDEEDAKSKALAIAALLERDMPEWQFTCKAYVIQPLTAPIGPGGYMRTCLFTGKTSLKCVSPDRLQETVHLWCMTSTTRRATVAWPDSECIAPLSSGEFRMIDRALTKVVSAGRQGVPRHEVVSEFATVSAKRAEELYNHLVHEHGRSLVAIAGDDQEVKLMAWWSQPHTTEEYRSNVWPSIEGSGSGPSSPIVPVNVQLVDTVDECNRVVDHLMHYHDAVALDCEGITPSGCLMDLSLLQIAGRDGIVYVFDMLCPEASRFMDGGLRSLLESHSIIKIVHDGRSDLSVLFRRYACRVNGFVDTQITYAIAQMHNEGRKVLSLNALLAAFPRYEADGELVSTINEDKVAVSKQMSRDYWCWHRRPLTARMVRYAASDVRYLVHAYDGLMKTMSQEQRGRAILESTKRAEELFNRSE